MKRVLGIGFGIVLAAACLWLFWRGVQNPERLWSEIRSANIPLLGVLVVSAVLHLVLRAWRWRTLLGAAGRRAPFSDLFGAVSVGYMASLLPARIGEVIRPTLLARRTSVPFGAALATVGAERAVLDMPLLIVMLALSLVLPAEWTGVGTHAGAGQLARMRAFGVVALAISAVGIGIVMLLGRYGARVDAALERWAGRRGGRAAGLAHRVIASLLPGLATFGSLGGTLRLAVETLLIWTVIGVGIHAGVVASGVPIAPLAMLMVMPVTAFSFLAMTPGGAGAYQLAMLWVLTTAFGVPNADAAAAASIVVYAVPLLPVLVLGGAFALRFGLAPAGEGRGAPPALQPTGSSE